VGDQRDMSDATLYGPSALATPANVVTIIRLLVAPLVLLLIVHDGSSWPIFFLWVALAGTDGVDGWIARRHGTTRSGAFLDPLADKVLVLGALYALVYIGRFWWLPVAVLAVRELVITIYRSQWGRRGVAVPARPTAKVKTALQSIAVALAVFPLLADWWFPADAVLWASVFMAVLSAVQYGLDGRHALTTLGSHPH
jgi:CDP-diacylglycerol---glycerol-3-phosphate 3-phosphatidyltransferase